ncbi:hypothetical protein IMSAGC011_01219 [Lachnospiraceae bacterium]|nr:hypothetical protein IMSAGC011_01219 [Lachnospiraceae bacterium]
MAVWLLKMFGYALILTLIIELGMAFFLGIRSRKVLLLILFVNILTNPPAVLLYWLGNLYLPDIVDFWLQLVIELVVVIVESLIYYCFSIKKNWNLTHPILLSFTTNICSWIIGLLILVREDFW